MRGNKKITVSLFQFSSWEVHTPVVCVLAAGSSPELLFYPPWLQHKRNRRILRGGKKNNYNHNSRLWQFACDSGCKESSQLRGLCCAVGLNCAKTTNTHTACSAPSACVALAVPVGSSWPGGDTIVLACPFMAWEKCACISVWERKSKIKSTVLSYNFDTIIFMYSCWGR